MDSTNSPVSPPVGTPLPEMPAITLNPVKAETLNQEWFGKRIALFGSIQLTSELKTELTALGFSNASQTDKLEDLIVQIADHSIDMLLIDSNQFLDSELLNSAVAECKLDPQIPVLAISRVEDTAGKKMALEAGVEDFVSFPIERLELVTRIRNTFRSHLATDQLHKYSTQLQTDSLIDPLTNIANRRAFDFELSRKMIEWQRQRTPLALLMIDVDFFKQVNDQYGHQAGDAVLAQVASEIKEALREMDLICRFGGEEFAAILPIKRPHESTQSAERIRKQIENTTFRSGDQEMQITVSIGVAEAMKGDDQELIIKRADTALYESKQNGRNLVTFHDGARCKAYNQSGSSAEPIRRRAETQLEKTLNDEVINLCASHILIANNDDQSSTQTICQFLSEKGFRNLLCENKFDRVMDYFVEQAPELLLLKVASSERKSFDILKSIRSNERIKHIPVIAMTSESDLDARQQAMELGANDFLQIPILSSELVPRVSNTLLASAHSRFLSGYATKIEQEVKLRTSELVASRREAIQCLARVAELRDDPSGRHVIRVGKYSAIIAEELGFTESQVIEMEHAAQLHDVGKIGVPDTILSKQDELTDEEFDIVKAHCGQGGQIIRDETSSDDETGHPADCFLLDTCSSAVMRMAALVAESHHERWDGSGYPKGLRGDNIPIEGRIAAVCDVFDAISNPKSYRHAFDLDTCFQIIEEGSGTHFDPEIVEAFFRRKEDVIQIYHDFGPIEVA